LVPAILPDNQHCSVRTTRHQMLRITISECHGKIRKKKITKRLTGASDVSFFNQANFALEKLQ
jgi:hypothetical protein